MEKLAGRRDFIKKLTAAGLFASTVGYPSILTASSNRSIGDIDILPPVNVSHDRLIRQIAGLRPYRPSGFNLSVQKMDDKTIIHNYGHGGGGISLSWGTASLAIEKVDAATRKVAVLGAGVVGLSTAILLLKQGKRVTLYTEKLPPNTTSNVAAAFWAPVSVYEKEKVDNLFLDDFTKASQISQRMFQDLVGHRYGVWWMKTFFLGLNFDFPGGKSLYPEYKAYQKDTSPFDGYSIAEELHSLMIEPPIYLKALLDDFHQLGGQLTIKKFNQPNELMNLEESVTMNCTGLGSHHLFADKSLIPVKGQLAVLLPQKEIKYGYVQHSKDGLLYMFPRKDGVILGGTSEQNNWNLSTNRQDIKNIIDGHKRIADNLKT